MTAEMSLGLGEPAKALDAAHSREAHTGQHVAVAGGRVVAVWPSGPRTVWARRFVARIVLRPHLAGHGPRWLSR